MESDDLTDEQRNTMSRFQEVTQIESLETSHQYLTAHDWNVERAIEAALIAHTDLPRPIEQRPPNTSVIARYLPHVVVRFLRTPLSFLYTFYVKFQPLLPWNLARAVFSFFRSFLGGERPRNALDEIDHYCQYFNDKYGTRHPAFHRGTLAQALKDAQREIRVLFVYLHDKKSPLCDRFCREILCQEALPTLIGNGLFWSSSRDMREGNAASRLLNVNQYPCLCMIVHQGSQQTVQLKLDRYSDPDEYLAEIINGIQHADQTLEHNRERRNMSHSRDRLLEEQNAAYLESVRADEEKAAQRAREDDERRQLDEEQQKKSQKFADFRQSLKLTLPSEPPATDHDTIQVSIRLPVNEPLRRRFRRHEPAKYLFEFAWTNSHVPDQFELLWGYPRKRYQYEQITDQTIGELMNGNTETCYLEQIDEEK